MSSYKPEILKTVCYGLSQGKKQKEIARANDLNKNTVTRYANRIREMNETMVRGLLMEVLDHGE